MGLYFPPSKRVNLILMTKTPLNRSVIGIVPAAGRATRLPNRDCSKELLPIDTHNDDGGSVRPRLLSEDLVGAMVEAGAESICMVIAPDKNDIVRHYGSGHRHGVSISYLCQDHATGMSDAIDIAYPWLRDATVLMGMPDTIVRPQHSLASARNLL